MCSSIRVTQRLSGQNLVSYSLFLSRLDREPADLERAGKKALNQNFELRESSLDFPVPHKGGAGVDKDPDAESPRGFVRGQRDDRD